MVNGELKMVNEGGAFKNVGAPVWIKPYNRPYGRGKCTPSAACGGVFPGGADFSGAMP